MKALTYISIALTISAFFTNTLAQKIYADPETPTVNDEVIITFDITQCDRQELLNCTDDVYVHTGVFIEGGTQWDYLIAGWNENLEKAKCTRVSDNKYEITLSPDVSSYYGIPSNKTVTSLNFVLRNADGTAQTEDLSYKIYEPGLTIEITEPERDTIITKGRFLTIRAKSVYLGTDAPTHLDLLVDNLPVYTSSSDTIYHQLFIADTGSHWVHVKGHNSGFMEQDSVLVYVKEPLTKQDLTHGVTDGINYHGDTAATLVLYAPGKESVFLIGDFNNWQLEGKYQMFNTPDGDYWWITLSGLEAGVEYGYQYLVDGNLRIADPYTEKVLDPLNDKFIPETTYPNLKLYPHGKTTHIVSVFETGQEGFPWQEFLFIPPKITDLVIYETHIQGFLDEGTFSTLTDTLNYLEQLGVNAIELMPVNEFEGNQSWGYNPSFYFAVDKAYGTKKDFQNFVQECHKRGIAVIIDMVLNHSFGQSPLVRLYWDTQTGKPSAGNPWFNPDPKHDFNVGYDMNHESQVTKDFSMRVMKFWLEEFHIDGFRFDLSKGFTQKNTLGNVTAWGQYDTNRVALWKEYADTIWKIKPDAYVILEHLADNEEEKDLANYGLLPWTKMTNNYNEALMGYHDANKSDLSWAFYTNRGWDNPHAIVYMESHDEERLMYKTTKWGASYKQYDIRKLKTGLQRMELAAAFFLTVPGPKMIWQWGELAYDYSLFRCKDGSVDYDNDMCKLSPKPICWDYCKVPERFRLLKVFEALIDFKSLSICRTSDFDYSLVDTMKIIHLNGIDTNATIIGNFGLYNGFVDPAFQHAGIWYDYLTEESIKVEDVNAPIKLRPGEYKIYTDVRLDVIELPEAPFITDITAATSIQGLTSGVIYPNPLFGDLLNIRLNSLNYQGRISFELFDIHGNILLQKILVGSDQIGEIEIGHIPPQVLMYRINFRDSIKQGVLVRE